MVHEGKEGIMKKGEMNETGKVRAGAERKAGKMPGKKANGGKARSACRRRKEEEEGTCYYLAIV